MNIGIDGSNIVTGGGENHLLQVLCKDQLKSKQIDKIIIWSSQELLKKIPHHKKIKPKTNLFLNKNIFFRLFWQFFILPVSLKRNKCDVLLLPGASYVLTSIPKVSICQNLLPFDYYEIKRFGLSYLTLKLLILRFLQTLSFSSSDGIIFLSKFSKEFLTKIVNIKSKKTAVIYHGVNEEYFQKSKAQLNIKKYSFENPYRFLYVSHIWPYKNHLTIINSIMRLRNMGYPIVLDLVGGCYRPYFKKISKKISLLDPEKKIIYYHGLKNNNEVIEHYHKANAFIFGSSCETFGQILTEAMLSGLPIICSKESSMPEILGQSSFLYNPFSEDNLTDVIKLFLKSEKKRQQISTRGQLRAEKMTWKKCSKETFTFITQFGRLNKNNKLR